jgi:hypothetical protein
MKARSFPDLHILTISSRSQSQCSAKRADAFLVCIREMAEEETYKVVMVEAQDGRSRPLIEMDAPLSRACLAQLYASPWELLEIFASASQLPDWGETNHRDRLRQQHRLPDCPESPAI